MKSNINTTSAPLSYLLEELDLIPIFDSGYSQHLYIFHVTHSKTDCLKRKIEELETLACT